MKNVLKLSDLPIIDNIRRIGGDVYSVGGVVRDELLSKTSKDLDILVTGVALPDLELILSKYGKVDAVGKSFGILKFQYSDNEIDVAIPRVERINNEGGHKGFDVVASHIIPIEKDLKRRDFTINAMAKNVDGEIIDPFNGQNDLKNGLIRVVNPIAFKDDPLRMLRAVQFASRLDFEIESNTMDMIIDNVCRIKEITPERILIEFDKIVKKGNPYLAVKYLIKTKLYYHIFNLDEDNLPEMIYFDKVNSMGEFIYSLLRYSDIESPSNYYKDVMKGDTDTHKEIEALEFGYDFTDYAENNNALFRSVVSKMYLISKKSILSNILPEKLILAAQDLIDGGYPKEVKELNINGEDLMNMGYVNEEIGKMQRKLLYKVYEDELINDRQKLLDYIMEYK